MTHRDPEQDPMINSGDYYIIRLRRRSTSERLALVIWLIGLAILLDYALDSFREQENQAGILAGALFVGLLGAGIIVQVMRGSDYHSPYRRQERAAAEHLEEEQAENNDK